MNKGLLWGCWTHPRLALVNVMLLGLDKPCLGLFAGDWIERTSCIFLTMQIYPKNHIFKIKLVWAPNYVNKSIGIVFLSVLLQGIVFISVFGFSWSTNYFRFSTWTSWSRKVFKALQFLVLWPFSSWKAHFHHRLHFFGSPPMGASFLLYDLSQMGEDF